MHLLYFLLTIFGFIGWEAFWGYVGNSSIDGSVTFGLITGVFILSSLALLGLAGWGVWILT